MKQRCVITDKRSITVDGAQGNSFILQNVDTGETYDFTITGLWCDVYGDVGSYVCRMEHSDGTISVVPIIEEPPAGEVLDVILFYGHKQTGDAISYECFSNWYPSVFDVDGVRYCCMEQYMMAQKALTFEDKGMFDAIMLTSDPAMHKKYGRQVRGFNPAIWDKCKLEVVIKGIYAKFSQNPVMEIVLLNTGDAVLAEASPRDRIWGIGMGKNNPDAKNPFLWRGQNLLGTALVTVRNRLRAESMTGK